MNASSSEFNDLLDGLTAQQRRAVEQVIVTHSQEQRPTRDNVAAWVAVAKGEQTAADVAARWRQ